MSWTGSVSYFDVAYRDLISTRFKKSLNRAGTTVGTYLPSYAELLMTRLNRLGLAKDRTDRTYNRP